MPTDVEKALKALHGQGVKFIIIGGAAAVLHGSAYVTAVQLSRGSFGVES